MRAAKKRVGSVGRGSRKRLIKQEEKNEVCDIILPPLHFHWHERSRENRRILAPENLYEEYRAKVFRSLLNI